MTGNRVIRLIFGPFRQVRDWRDGRTGMLHRYAVPALLLVLGLGASACDMARSSSPSGPSEVDQSAPNADGASIDGFLGVWRSEQSKPPAAASGAGAAGLSAVPELRGCWNFQWNVTSQTATTIGGDISVECGDGITLEAAATGTLTSATTATLKVAGTGDVPGAGACAFTLDGVGTLINPDTLLITYSAATCLGPVSGETRLYRHDIFPDPEPEPEPEPQPNPEPPPPPPPADPRVPCALGNGPAIVKCIEDRFPDRLASGVSLNRRVENMAFLRDRIIEAGLCSGMDLARNLKRGVGPHSIDALAWRHSGRVDVVDIGSAYDDTSRRLRLSWQIVAGPPGYDRYPRPNC
jgi:hypothetical protein